LFFSDASQTADGNFGVLGFENQSAVNESCDGQGGCVRDDSGVSEIHGQFCVAVASDALVEVHAVAGNSALANVLARVGSVKVNLGISIPIEPPTDWFTVEGQGCRKAIKLKL